MLLGNCIGILYRVRRYEFRMVSRKNAERKKREKSAQVSSLVVSFSKSHRIDLFSLVT